MDTEMSDVPDVDIPDDASDDTALPLSEKEKTILELYDRLLEVEVELALYRARQALSVDENAAISQGDLKEAQQRLLEARASWTLRNDVVSSVMTANPIIESVHSGTEAGPIERDLLPHLQSRDEISSTLAKQHKQQQEVREELTRTQVEAMQTSHRNVELAATVLELAERAKEEGNVEDEETKEEMERLETEVKMSRQRWKVIKGTASAIVAGSGVDWVGDDELREMVLDGD
ncbi:hypothetical protein DL546_003530 [Coniochaeta pulveracea]|uniref:Centromere protein H C-terminal domain-containing protein n=1 Tax=Coniochaeta pulveracea TaxID=177199 RepID=A0A420Y160_9PEZI|nr:hypothetical protein DL546_003530 [Coniochaeta pulveracea]